jgi:hypothetical protein
MGSWGGNTSSEMYQDLTKSLTPWDRAYNEVVKDLAARVGWDSVTMEQARWDASLLIWHGKRETINL